VFAPPGTLRDGNFCGGIAGARGCLLLQAFLAAGYVCQGAVSRLAQFGMRAQGMYPSRGQTCTWPRSISKGSHRNLPLQETGECTANLPVPKVDLHSPPSVFCLPTPWLFPCTRTCSNEIPLQGLCPAHACRVPDCRSSSDPSVYIWRTRDCTPLLLVAPTSDTLHRSHGSCREHGRHDEGTAGVRRGGVVADPRRDGRGLRRRQPGRWVGREDRLQVLGCGPNVRSRRHPE
jgi:hypothetical protein